MATLHIEIPDQKAAALKSYAQAQGLAVEKWLEQLVEQAAPSSAEPPVVEDDRPIWEIFADAMKDVRMAVEIMIDLGSPVLGEQR